MANSKYKIGDKVRWITAGDSVLVVGEIFNLYADAGSNLWYQIRWDIVEPKGFNPEIAKDHTVPVLVIDNGSDIRSLTPAEEVLYCE